MTLRCRPIKASTKCIKPSLNRFVSVSYTHLDVYKRQTLESAIQLHKKRIENYYELRISDAGIIGLRSNMLTATAGEAIMTHRLKDFEPWVGEIEMRTNGSIISGETGTVISPRTRFSSCSPDR